MTMVDGDQSISRKRKKTRKKDNQSQSLSVDDLLSDLPLGIIHCILARIPIQDAVRTCVLSSKWRYKWASLPHLVFDDGCVKREGKTVTARRDCFQKFITNALLLHKGPVHEFGIHVNFEISSLDIDQWLLYLSRNEIREIILGLRYYSGRPHRVHSCLYSCQKLTHLELSGCESRPPPLNFKGFSFLRSLSLHGVMMPSALLESLIAKSPLLEKFTYRTLTSVMNSELRFSAPMLKYIHLTSSFKEINVCAPLVAELFVRWAIIESPADQLQQKSRVCTYSKFFDSFTNLEKLTAEGCFTEYLSIGIESYDRSLVFHRLKSIILYEVSFEDKKQLAVVGHLIMSTPNLHELKISIRTGYETDESDESDESGSTPISFSDFGCLPNFTFKKLRVVLMKHVCGLPCEMGFIKYLLKSSPLLQTMNLYSESKLRPEVRFNLATKVLRYCRASPNAAIVLL